MLITVVPEVAGLEQQGNERAPAGSSASLAAINKANHPWGWISVPRADQGWLCWYSWQEEQGAPGAGAGEGEGVWGHSQGARTAWELLRDLRAEACPAHSA